MGKWLLKNRKFPEDFKQKVREELPESEMLEKALEEGDATAVASILAALLSESGEE